MEPNQVYELLRLLTSPVVAITSKLGEKRNGMISDGVVRASIVPDIPRLLIVIHKVNLSHDLIIALAKSISAALKPGGTLLVVDHVAVSGAGWTMASTLHRIDPEAVKSDMAAAGFKLDAESPTYALDVLTLVESILENPDFVLRQQLDAVKAGLERVISRLPVGVDHAGNLAGLERARGLVRHRLAVGRPGFQIGDRHRRRRDRQHAAGLERGMRDPADMPQLQEDDPALGVNGIDDLSPAGNLLLRIDAGHAGAAESGGHDRRRLGDDQSARRSTLGVIFDVQRPRRKRGFFRPHPRQRRHRDAMPEMIGTNLQR